MRVNVNGEACELPAGATVSALLGALGVPAERLVVERNGEVLPPERYADTRLAEGDRIELVRFVGGG